MIDADPRAGEMKVVFVPNYGVTIAERLIPATDVSEQISTAGYEASGTSNMKFMMNGALTIGTRDGATIEMAQEAGEETSSCSVSRRSRSRRAAAVTTPMALRARAPHAALDLIAGDHFSETNGARSPRCSNGFLKAGDHYMHLADLSAYLRADEALCALYADRHAWARKAIINIAGSGRFSSDRTIAV